MLLLATFQTWVTTPLLPSNNSLEKIAKTTLGKLMMTKLGSISRDAFPHRLDGMTEYKKLVIPSERSERWNPA
jgi:hypothetical protein